MAIIVQAVTTVGNCGFWLFLFLFPIDSALIEEFKSGKKVEGVMISYMSLVLKVGGAIGGLIVGLILSASGYVGDVDSALEEAIPQTQQALDAIESMYTLYPGIIMLISVFFIVLLPINKKRLAALSKNLELKKHGRKYSTEGFEELL